MFKYVGYINKTKVMVGGRT